MRITHDLQVFRIGFVDLRAKAPFCHGMFQSLSHADRVALVSVLFLLRDRYPAIRDDPLWLWIVDEIAPMPQDQWAQRVEKSNEFSDCMIRCLALVRNLRSRDEGDS